MSSLPIAFPPSPSSREMAAGIQGSLAPRLEALSWQLQRLQREHGHPRGNHDDLDNKDKILSASVQQVQDALSELLTDVRYQAAGEHIAVLLSSMLTRLSATAAAIGSKTSSAPGPHLCFNKLHLYDNRAVTLLEFIHEAAKNAFEHSGGALVRVCLKVSGRVLFVSIADDGRGFDPLIVEGAGIGRLRAHAEALKGSLSLDTRHGAGTRIHLAVPVLSSEDVA